MNYRNHHQIMGTLLPLLFLICLNILPIGGHSQTFLDFKKAKSIEEKIRKADLIAVRYSSHSIDTLKIIGYELLVASNIHENELGVNFARKYLGMYFIRCGREDDGLRLLRLSKNHFLASENFTMAAKVATEIGIGYQNKGKLDEAMNWYQQALKFADIEEDKKIKYISLLNIAQIHIAKNEMERAKSAAITYKDWALSNKSNINTTNAYAVLGNIYLQQSAFSDAIEYFELSDKYAKKTNDNAGRAHATNNIAIAKFIEGFPEKSLELFKNSLELRKKVKNVIYICDAYLNLGGIYYEMGRYNEAVSEYEKGLRLATDKHLIQNEIDFLNALIEAKNTLKLPIPDLLNKLEIAENKLTEDNSKASKNDDLLHKELNHKFTDSKIAVEKTNKLTLYIGGALILLAFLIIIPLKSKSVREKAQEN